MFTRVKLTSVLIESFAGAYCSPMYDDPKPTPDFHREAWDLYCSEAVYAAVAAPRGHAKSTALTHDYSLATVLFREQDYVVIVSATEGLAINHLGDIAKELRENEDIAADFKIKGLSVDAKTEIVVDFEDGHQAKLIAKGSGQKMRGLKWNGKRPGLIVCDDLEEDEQVESADARKKFRKWFNRALIPCLRVGGKVRVHGTILLEDALLARLLKEPTWKTLKYSAHRSFDDFSDILWPQQYSEIKLREIRQGYIDGGDASGYSQEYLNDPYDSSEAFIRAEDMLPMDGDDFKSRKKIKVGCDFAVTKSKKADKTSFTIGGKDVQQTIHVLDNRSDRWNVLEWVEVMFEINEAYSKVCDDLEFVVEGGVIWKSVEPMLYAEMRARGKFLNIRVINPVKDKAARGRPFQKATRAHAMRFNKDTSWYATYEAVVLRFTAIGEALHDDEFDSTALMVKGFEQDTEVEEDDFDDEEEMEFKTMQKNRGNDGRSSVTGY